MPHVRIYHNPRCSKSRQTLELLREHNIEPEIIEYLETPPSITELRELLNLLNLDALDLIRKKENIFNELNLRDADEDALIDAMVANPKLIERPIVVKGQHAVLGRPPENILELLND
jgi:arsenate reductase